MGRGTVSAAGPPELPVVVPQVGTVARSRPVPRTRRLPLSSLLGPASRRVTAEGPHLAASSTPARRRHPAVTPRPGLSWRPWASRGTAPVQGAAATPATAWQDHKSSHLDVAPLPHVERLDYRGWFG